MARAPIVATLCLVAAGAIAAEVPRLDVTATCRAAPNLGGSATPPYDACMRDETAARSELERRWDTFTASDRSECTAETRTGGSPSYIDVLTCLEMYAANAKPAPK